MSERLRAISRHRRKAFAAVLCGLAIGGCGDSVVANKASVNPCGNKDYNRTSGEVISSTAPLLSRARTDVLTLFTRAKNVGGSINLRRYADITEIATTPEELDLSFERPDNALIPSSDYYEDIVSFPIKDGSTSIAIGAIACYDNHDQLTTNGTYQSLEQYVEETAALRQ